MIERLLFTASQQYFSYIVCRGGQFFLLVEDTAVPGKKHRPATVTDKNLPV
jgi:hypothetical protein